MKTFFVNLWEFAFRHDAGQLSNYTVTLKAENEEQAEAAATAEVFRKYGVAKKFQAIEASPHIDLIG